ncbi:hypothetical protein HHI36_018109 [Cryptolaemus montrouzieri]|uniref:Uncharacterized protein n=1 Tax=Cryptolaemus montrouzieri TaxID=559131 RepID=A0ABD2NZ19_9CUCU
MGWITGQGIRESIKANGKMDRRGLKTAEDYRKRSGVNSVAIQTKWVEAEKATIISSEPQAKESQENKNTTLN